MFIEVYRKLGLSPPGMKTYQCYPLWGEQHRSSWTHQHTGQNQHLLSHCINMSYQMGGGTNSDSWNVFWILFPPCFLYKVVLIFIKLMLLKLYPLSGYNHHLSSHYINICHDLGGGTVFDSWIVRHQILLPPCFLLKDVLIFTKLKLVELLHLLNHYKNISHHGGGGMDARLFAVT